MTTPDHAEFGFDDTDAAKVRHIEGMETNRLAANDNPDLLSQIDRLDELGLDQIERRRGMVKEATPFRNVIEKLIRRK